MAPANAERTPHVLMCPPDYFGVEYEINAWMNQQRKVDHALAVEQWRRLHEIVQATGATVSLLPPQPGLPDLVFTANAAFIFQQRAILSRFRHEQRQGEETHNARWLEANGFKVETLPAESYFEGAGDALFCGDTLFAGYRMRSEVSSMQTVAKSVGVRVIPMELIAPHFYHLDTCFCPINAETAFYFPDAFDEYGLSALKSAIPQLIEVAADEAQHFACNAVVLNNKIIMNVGCDSLAEKLGAEGFEVIQTPLSEFVKAGGSAKCLTLRLDGEDAAFWREPQ